MHSLKAVILHTAVDFRVNNCQSSKGHYSLTKYVKGIMSVQTQVGDVKLQEMVIVIMWDQKQRVKLAY